MRITIKNMAITNFKGIQSKVIDFEEKRTVIAGDNGVGKTTVADAFFWALFGKDSLFRSKFDIIPLDKNNNPIHHLDTSVEINLDIDGKVHKLVRMLKENWVKKRGEGGSPEFKGTVSSYFIDDAPALQKEYDAFIADIIDEEKFKLLSSTTYFNSQMKWEDRRKLLSSLIKAYTYDDIVVDDEFEPIRDDVLNVGYDKTKAKYKFQKDGLDKEKIDLPTRIDEQSRNINRDETSDVETLKEKRQELRHDLDKLRKDVNDNYLTESEKLRKDIDKLNDEISKSAVDTSSLDILKKDKATLESKRSSILPEITSLNREIKNAEDKINSFTRSRVAIKSDYTALLNLEYVATSDTCPTCSQPLPESMRQDAKTKFDLEKDHKLKGLLSETREKKLSIEDAQSVIDSKKELVKIKQTEYDNAGMELNDINNQIVEEQANITPDERLQNRVQKRDALKLELSNLKAKDITVETSNIEEEIDLIGTQLDSFESSEKAKARVKELIEELTKVNDSILEVEKLIALLDALNLKYMSTIEGDLNSLFDGQIQVRMFVNQVNGGYRDACDILVMSDTGALVPYEYVNTAGQINSSLRVIQLLSKHFDIFCPVFIDHAESVGELFPIDSQTIELEFVKALKELTIK